MPWSLLLGCVGVGEIRVDEIELDALVLGRMFVVRLGEPAPASITCTTPSDPDEVHVLESPAGQDHGFTVLGLLADTDYECTIRAGEGRDQLSERISFTTDPLPDWLPEWTTALEPDPDRGYTLLNHGLDTDQRDREPKLLIVDPEGRLRWYHQVPQNASDLDAQYLGDGRVLFGGGYATPPTVIGLLGVIEAEAGPSSTDRPYHHHAEQLPSGEVVTMTLEKVTDGVEEWDGFVVEILDETLQERTWTWRSQRGVDEGWLPYVAGNPDPYHPNSVQVDGDDVYLNLRSLNRLLKLDRQTGDLLWSLGPRQDFDLVDATGAPAPLEAWFYMPHAPERNGDRILMHDNGVGRPGGGFSRAVELEIDEEARTATVVWEFTEPGWFEPIWGDVDRLPNGNVLVTRAHCEHCTPDQEGTWTEILEVDPATNTVVWRMTYSDPLDGGYRAARIAPCDIFANQKYCR